MSMKLRNRLLILGLALIVVIGVSGCQKKSESETQEMEKTETPVVEESTKSTFSGPLASNSTIYRYLLENQGTDFAYLTFNFSETTEAPLWAQAFIDYNNNGTYEADEWVVRNQPARVVKDFPHRFAFSVGMERFDTGALKGKLLLTENKSDDERTLTPFGEVDVVYEIVTEVLDTEFGLDVPGASEDLKRGVGAGADFEETGFIGKDIPDLTGGSMDCFAIATANNMIALASKNDRRADLPEDPQALIDELKTLMAYKDGITNANFLVGKAAFVKKYNLPVRTEEIKKPTIEDLEMAFANGDAVEVSTTMIRSRSGRANTGHVLTGISAYQDGDEAGLAVHDPATPVGTDTMSIRMSDGDNPYILLDYPMWDGIVFVDTIFVQYWEDQPEDTDSSTRLMPTDPALELAFSHVKPGEYSEVYASVTGVTPGSEVTAYLTGGGQTDKRVIVSADANGVAYFTWRIYQYDDYYVSVQVDGIDLLDDYITVK